mgnify:CR=1 FL=1
MYGLSDVMCFFLYRVFRYRRAVVRSNITQAFPSKTFEEISTIERRFYRHFCDLAFESIKALTISEDEARKRMHVHNPELINALYEQHRSLVLYSGHQGLWEWLLFLPLWLRHDIVCFYKPLRSNYFDGLMQAIRRRLSGGLVPSDQGYRTILRHQQDNHTILSIMIGDQSPRSQDAKHWCYFLGRPTAFLIGAGKIAAKSGQAVVFPEFQKRRRGYYQLRFQLLHEGGPARTESIIEAYAGALEHAIAQQPELWLWSHRRWKLNDKNLAPKDMQATRAQT